MTKENGVKVLTDMVADFVAHIGKKLPDDVVDKTGRAWLSGKRSTSKSTL